MRTKLRERVIPYCKQQKAGQWPGNKARLKLCNNVCEATHACSDYCRFVCDASRSFLCLRTTTECTSGVSQGHRYVGRFIDS